MFFIPFGNELVLGVRVVFVNLAVVLRRFQVGVGKVVRVKDLLSPDLQLKLELQKPADTDDRINK